MINAIPLTTDILISCGFIQKDNYLFHPELSLRWEYDSLWKEEGDNLNNLGQPKFLHTLQNGVRNFMGVELEVNLNKEKV